MCFLLLTRARDLHPEAPLSWGASPLASALQGAFLGHYAATTADTWASELGVLCRARPRLLTSGAEVPAGTNGGVSMGGTAASVAGGGFIGLLFFLLGEAMGPGGDGAPSQWPLVPMGAIAGFVGSLIDSLLGGMHNPLGCPARNLSASKLLPSEATLLSL